jgi:ankyrin repeat protein
MKDMGNRLIDAAISGDLMKVRQLFDEGADANFANRLGVTALMVAAQWNRPEVVRFLLSKGADVEAQESSSGCNALMFACLSGNPEVVRLVLEHGASVNARNIDGRTALMTAAFCGSIELVKMLLRHGADVEATDRFGSTALSQASIAGHRDVVNLLMKREADATRHAVNLRKQRSGVSRTQEGTHRR